MAVIQAVSSAIADIGALLLFAAILAALLLLGLFIVAGPYYLLLRLHDRLKMSSWSSLITKLESKLFRAK